MKNCSLSRLFILLTICSFTLFACQKENDVNPSGKQPKNLSELITINTENPEMEARVQISNEAIILSDTSLSRSECQQYAAWTKTAEVTTLNYNNDKMSTTHVALSGDLALVSYHIRGGTHVGAVEIIDLKDPAKPKIKSQAVFYQADVNALAIEKNPNGNITKVWVALSDSKNGAVLGELRIKNKKFENYFAELKLAYELNGSEISSSANDVTEAGDYLYVTTGSKEGGVFCVDKDDFTVLGYKQFPNAKGVASNGDIPTQSKVAAIQTNGTPGIHTDVVGGFNFDNFFSINAISHQNVDQEFSGKTTATFSTQGSNYLMVTNGRDGITGYDITNGETVFSSPVDLIKNGNANGISSDDEYLYVACGADGLAIFPILANGLPDESSVYLWDLDEPDASANYVASNEGWVFIAKGAGGFKILKKPSPGDCLPVCSYDDDGVPDCTSNNVTLCSSLTERIELAMPFGEELEEIHPAYFTSGEKEILLLEDATLKVTFVEENTQHKHSLGYYFYHEDCPPANVDDLIGMITFINFSAEGSGGSLEPGSTIKVPGEFKAGTRIGFFFLKNGWTGGHQAYFTNPIYNNNNKRQGLLFYDATCGDIIGAFSDHPLPSNNADFRDMIFKVTPSSPTAIAGHDYLTL